MIPLIRLCYTLSCSQHANVVTLGQSGCKRNILVFLFSHVYCYDTMFLKQYHSGLEEVIHIVLAP